MFPFFKSKDSCFYFFLFLVTNGFAYEVFSRVLRDSTPRYVGWSVSRSVGSFLSSGPEGADDLCFHIGGNFVIFFSVPPPATPCLNPGLEAQIPVSGLKSQSQRSNPNIVAQIPISRLKSQSQGSNPSIVAQIPVSRFKSLSHGSNPSLEAQILVLRLNFQPRGLNRSPEAHIPVRRLISLLQ